MKNSLGLQRYFFFFRGGGGRWDVFFLLSFKKPKKALKISPGVAKSIRRYRKESAGTGRICLLITIW